jgi:hypothetical protein
MSNEFKIYQSGLDGKNGKTSNLEILQYLRTVYNVCIQFKMV